MGEVGKLQSSQITRKMTKPNEIDVSISSLPKKIVLGIPFWAEFIVKNRSMQMLNLQLKLKREAMKGIFCNSLSNMVRCRFY